MKYLLLLSILFASIAFADKFEDTLSRAEAGDALAQLILGAMYDEGEGVLEDYKEAAKWTRAAAEQGDADAQFKLGLLYYLGHGVLEDYIRAHMWFNIASVNGNDKAGEMRKMVSEDMTSSQIEQAQKMAQVCLSSDYEDC